MYAFNKETSIAPYELSELDKIAIQYHFNTETFDRMYLECRGGRYIPATPYEHKLVSANAEREWYFAKNKALSKGFSTTDLKGKMSEWLRVSYEELCKYENKKNNLSP